MKTTETDMLSANKHLKNTNPIKTNNEEHRFKNINLAPLIFIDYNPIQ
jgi:hypothetical protein